ncbi:hypothetical protein [Pseudomonas shirazensis]|uniref:hypothetical protein n=1 Tax=Pseudomonas shirazensis TaxID=2745494 RepID=UPI003D2D97BD
MKITLQKRNRLHSPLAQPRLLLALAAVLYGNTAHASLEPVLEERMTVCTGHLQSVEQQMVGRIQHIENSVGSEIRRLPELEAARGRLERQLQQERQRYQSLPWRPEHDQALRGISNEIAAIQYSIAIGRSAERQIAAVKSLLASSRETRQSITHDLDEFLFAGDDCAANPARLRKCQADALALLKPPAQANLIAGRRLLEKAWSPLRDQGVRFPTSWEVDCSPDNPPKRPFP